MGNRYEREFVEMHEFFRAWFRGEVAKTEAAFSRMVDVCAEGFSFVTTTGTVLGREEVLKRFFDRHGAVPTYDFWIEDATVRQRHGDVTICTFTVEGGEERSGERVRATAVFCDEASAPNGVVFLFVQDTPIAG